MAAEPWKTQNWFVSPWNFHEEVLKDLHFPKQIKIHDITLRDGEQQTGIILSKDDKIRIAEGLAEAGVHRIEAGMPIVSPSDAEAIKDQPGRELQGGIGPVIGAGEVAEHHRGHAEGFGEGLLGDGEVHAVEIVYKDAKA